MFTANYGLINLRDHQLQNLHWVIFRSTTTKRRKLSPVLFSDIRDYANLFYLIRGERYLPYKQRIKQPKEAARQQHGNR